MIALLRELFAAGASETAAGVLLVLGLLGSAVCALRLAAADLREHRLPNRIVYPWTAGSVVLLGLVGLLAGDLGAWARAISAGLLWSLGFLLVRLIHPSAIGMGDVKLALVLGLWTGVLGWAAVGLAVVLSFLLGGLLSLGLLVTGRATRRSRIPFGPLLLLGAALALVVW